MGGIAHADINLSIVLRRCIVPKFFELVGPVSWRRKVATVSLTAGDQDKDLADDYGSMMEVALSDRPGIPLTYIGDNPLKLMAAEVNTTRARPGAYYVTRRTGGETPTELFKRIKFDCPADQAYTVAYVYYSHVQFTDDTTDVNLDKYVPGQFQWTLVEGLKAYIYTVRSGLGDRRKAEADAEEMMRTILASQDRELSSGATPRYVS